MTTCSNIDPRFPVPGKDQSSQGFRANFLATKIEALQSKTLVFTGALQGTSSVVLDGGTVPVLIDDNLVIENTLVGLCCYINATPPAGNSPSASYPGNSYRAPMTFLVAAPL
jgi:hypothetical protein